MRILNAQLEVGQRQMLMLPYGAKPLKVIVKSDLPYLYFQTYRERDLPSNKPEARIFRTVCSGEDFEGGTYIDSFTLNGWFIGHLYETTDASVDLVDNRYADDFAAIKKEIGNGQ
jgi:hypothetical protein